MNSNKIIISGFMGSGKTEVAEKLGELYGYSFVDLDKEVERSENSNIKDIFSTKGEAYFRKIESDVLSLVLESSVDVIALGGGSAAATSVLFPFGTNVGAHAAVDGEPFKMLVFKEHVELAGAGHCLRAHPSL